MLYLKLALIARVECCVLVRGFSTAATVVGMKHSTVMSSCPKMPFIVYKTNTKNMKQTACELALTFAAAMPVQFTTMQASS